MIKISLIMPVYNGEQHLDRSINSIINQTFKDFELILVNDGSTDASPQICDYYAMKDNRVRVIHKNNEGSGPSRNRGILEAKGEYITFPDSDDILEPTMLERLYDLHKANDVDLVVCGYNSIRENGEMIAEHYYPTTHIVSSVECKKKCIELLTEDVIRIPWNKLYVTKIVKENNIVFPPIRRAQDTVFNVRYIGKIEKMLIVEERLYNYRVESNGGIFNKLPEEAIKIDIQYYELMQALLREWECYDEAIERFLYNEFNQGLKRAIENTYNPKWNYGFKKRYAKIKELLNLAITKESIKYSKGSRDLYQSSVNLCIQKRCPIGVMFLMRAKITIKGIWRRLR